MHWYCISEYWSLAVISLTYPLYHDVRYFMPDDEVQETRMKVCELNPGTAKIFSELRGPPDRNFNTCQINGSSCSAVGENDDQYLQTRAIQLLAPGILQIHYHGLLACKNDFELYEKTKQPRDINRHNPPRFAMAALFQQMMLVGRTVKETESAAADFLFLQQRFP